jgi:hypothetical protein
VGADRADYRSQKARFSSFIEAYLGADRSALRHTRLHAEVTVSRNNRATISIDWNTNDPEIRARPFAPLHKDNTL